MKHPKCVRHEPIIELERGICSTRLAPGKVGFSYFGDGKWYCAKCGRTLRPQWRTAKRKEDKLTTWGTT